MAVKKQTSSHWTRAVCHANGIDVHYWRTGGDKPVLILLHGLAENGVSWTAVARALENRYDIIMPDARGHGMSSSPIHGYTYLDHAQDVIELIRALDLQSPYLIGHGMGGMTAAMVASRLGLAIGGIVLADPTFIHTEGQGEHYARAMAAQQLQILRRSKESVMAAARVKHPHLAAEMVANLVESRLQTSLSAFEVLVPPHPEFKELVRNIYVPTLLVLGGEGMVTTQDADALHTLHPGLQYKLIEDAGHGLMYDKPVRLALAVDVFLRPHVSAVSGIFSMQSVVADRNLSGRLASVNRKASHSSGLSWRIKSGY